MKIRRRDVEDWVADLAAAEQALLKLNPHHEAIVEECDRCLVGEPLSHTLEQLRELINEA